MAQEEPGRTNVIPETQRPPPISPTPEQPAQEGPIRNSIRQKILQPPSPSPTPPVITTSSNDTKQQFRFVVLEYNGGSWEHMAREMRFFIDVSIPFYLRWLDTQNLFNVNESIETLKPSDPKIFNYPFLYISGHFRFNLSEEETKNIKSFIERGGFIYMDDYGSAVRDNPNRFSLQAKELLTSMFPGGEFKLLPKSHAIFKTPFAMPVNRPANIDPANYDPDRDDVVPLSGSEKNQGGCRIYLNGYFYKGRMLALFSDAGLCYQTTLLRGPDPASDNRSYKIFTNILTFAMSH